MNAPARPNGIERITDSGSTYDSYCAERIRYTKVRQSTKMIAVELLDSCSVRVRPENSYVYPAGSVAFATSDIALMASPVE